MGKVVLILYFSLLVTSIRYYLQKYAKLWAKPAWWSWGVLMEPRNFLESFEVVIWKNKVARRTSQSCWVLTYPTEFPTWTNWPIGGENQKSANFQTSSMTVYSPAQDYLLSILFINYFSDSPDKNVYFNLKWMLKLN